MSQIVFQSVVYKEGRHYVAQCLNIDISSFGNSEKSALHNLREALELYLEDAPNLTVSTSIESPTVHTLRLQNA